MASPSQSRPPPPRPAVACCISLFLLASTLFFLLFPPNFSSAPFSPTPRRSLLTIPLLPQNSSSEPPRPPPCSSIRRVPPGQRCAFSIAHCHGDSNGLLNYAALHYCVFAQDALVSVPFLALVLVFCFYFLVKTAGDHFSPVVSKLARHLDLSPSMGAVTLLALGNGAPDVFASVAAVRGGHERTGLGAILSAGAFVSSLVVGFVAIYAAPFSVDPAPFVRDVFFYLVAASALFYVYLSAEIYLWQALGFVLFYVFFVGFVFRMDSTVGRGKGAGGKGGARGHGGGRAAEEVELGLVEEALMKTSEPSNWETREMTVDGGATKSGAICGFFRKMTWTWEVPVSILLRLTIPSTSPAEWNRFYTSANIALCPVILMFAFNSIIPLNHRIVFLLPQSHFPLWSVTLFVSMALGVAHYILERDPPETEQIPTTLLAFIMSVFWISTMAGELLNCLSALGNILELPPALLGLTVLAWGNSVGDLVADIAVAKAGQPEMAMAGCFVGPMFNMLVGLGTALVIETADVYPRAYELHFHVSIVVAFVFLLLSLMGSLLVVTWSRFRVPRFWGFCLVGLYLLFMVVSLVIATFSG
ncbi:hypothetical protein Taro_006173 [Colocasia esculenta]|uniref:Sodium/calcium exchanger membrane region domain-containing protein n=1 Tax=Colocasia esculenta TaxID=4460 RepID=A0A843TRS0_COLES|nr:hypothetical protein [Colocasia esculenta]